MRLRPSACTCLVRSRVAVGDDAMTRRDPFLAIAVMATLVPAVHLTEPHQNHASTLTQLTRWCQLHEVVHHDTESPSLAATPTSFELFSHIPLSGGTAWSWHLKATHEQHEIVPGSAVAAGFRLPTSCPKVA